MTERTHNFTGKSDFFDWCNMHYTPETIIEKATIFLGDAEIKKDKPEDLIPYYTHIIASAGCGSDKQNIFLSKQSWINLEEAEHIAIIIYDMIKVARKAKKEKVIFICFGSAFYMTADLGVSTYDAIALIICNTWKKGKFQYVRIITDLVCVILGVGLFLLAGGNVSMIPTIAGVGTIITAFFMGRL